MPLAIAIIHGMGTQKPGFSTETQSRLKDWYEAKGKNRGDLYFEEIYWADVLDNQEQRVLEHSNYNSDLTLGALRNFIINYLGDAVAYQPLDDPKDIDDIQTYKKIHERIRNGLVKLFSRAPTGSPLILMAHSLGSIMISNYLWDSQHPSSGLGSDMTGKRENDIDHLKMLTGIITFGSPLAMWALRFQSMGIPFRFPDIHLPREFSAKARWFNFYYRGDVIAYPLKHINEAYDRTVSEDIQLGVRNYLNNWNPLSHNYYWNSHDMLEQVATFLANF